MFHSVAFAVIDPETAKRQNLILHGERFASPSAQLPAQSGSSDQTHPLRLGTWRIYSIERGMKGESDREYLKRAFNKLLLSYAWWGNRVDQTGDNVFEGGFRDGQCGGLRQTYLLPDGSKIEKATAHPGWRCFP
jgi:hypothetical protein